jgi:hypothetical protein
VIEPTVTQPAHNHPIRAFTLKGLAFVLLLITVNEVIDELMPYYWGNPWYGAKIMHLESLPVNERPNTYFLGSSRVYRQINPAVFDSTFQTLTGSQITSFNLGAIATFAPQTYYLYDKFLESDFAYNTDYFFMELMNVTRINDDVLFQERNTYWHDFEEFWFSYKAVMDNPNIDKHERNEILLSYGKSFLGQLFNVGHYRNQVSEWNYYNEFYLGPNKDGYLSLDYDMIHNQDEVFTEYLNKRMEDLQKDSSALQLRAIDNTRNLSILDEGFLYDIHPERIQYLLKKSKEKGIHLIFFIIPNRTSETQVELFNTIPFEHRLELVDPNDYAEFYQLENSFDAGHLNHQGASLFTQALVREFLDLGVASKP